MAKTEKKQPKKIDAVLAALDDERKKSGLGLSNEQLAFIVKLVKEVG